jgi:hypothetical protein
MGMDADDIQEAINKTMQEIDQVKQELARTTDPNERQKLSRKLKDLQFLQLWNLDQRDRR